MHYLDEGRSEDPPVLLLHGNPTWSFMYRNLVRELKTANRCIAPDHIGCGLSDKPPVSRFSYDLSSHSLNVFELMNDLAIDRFNLVVHDWGGAIGLTAFRNQLHRINKLVLLNTAAFHSKDVPKRILFCRLPLLGGFFVRALNGFAWPATFMATSKGLSQEAKRGFLAPYDNWANRVAVWRFVRDIPHECGHPTRALLTETQEKLKDLRATEVLACWGMRDFCFHPGFLRKWIEILPDMQTRELHDSGHYLLEDSFEECRAAIEAFLQSKKN